MGEEFKDFEVEAPVLTLEPDLTEEKEEIAKNISLRRMGTPEDVANVVKLGIASINGMVVAAVCYLIGQGITKNK